MSKVVNLQTEETVQKTIEARRLELTESLKEKLNQLLTLMVDLNEKEEKDSLEFTTVSYTHLTLPTSDLV